MMTKETFEKIKQEECKLMKRDREKYLEDQLKEVKKELDEEEGKWQK